MCFPHYSGPQRRNVITPYCRIQIEMGGLRYTLPDSQILLTPGRAQLNDVSREFSILRMQSLLSNSNLQRILCAFFDRDRWLAYIRMKQLRYPSRPKMKHRAPATRNTSPKLSFADRHPLQMAVGSFSFPQYGSSIPDGRGFGERGNVANI